MTKVINATTANIFIFWSKDFASWLCQELGIYQAIWCLYFPLFLSWSKMRNYFSYVNRIFYRLSFLVSSCPYFGPPVVNHLFCDIVIEICRVLVIPPLTRLTKIVGINIIHSKDWGINFDTTILGMKLTIHRYRGNSFRMIFRNSRCFQKGFKGDSISGDCWNMCRVNRSRRSSRDASVMIGRGASSCCLCQQRCSGCEIN